MPSIDKITNMEFESYSAAMEYMGNPFLKGFYPAKSMKEKPEDATSESTMDKNRTLNSHCKMKKSDYFEASLSEDAMPLFVCSGFRTILKLPST